MQVPYYKHTIGKLVKILVQNINIDIIKIARTYVKRRFLYTIHS